MKVAGKNQSILEYQRMLEQAKAKYEARKEADEAEIERLHEELINQKDGKV